MVGLVCGDVHQIHQLCLDALTGAAGLAGDHIHHQIQAAAGGFQRVASHLGPFPLDDRQQGFKALPEQGRCRRTRSRTAAVTAGFRRG